MEGYKWSGTIYSETAFAEVLRNIPGLRLGRRDDQQNAYAGCLATDLGLDTLEDLSGLVEWSFERSDANSVLANPVMRSKGIV